MKHFYITIKFEDNGERLDKIIPAHVTDCSRTKARKLIAAGAVRVDNKRIRKLSYAVHTGQTILIHDVNHLVKDSKISANLTVVYDDPWYVVVCKPSGMPSDETKAGSAGTVTDILSRMYPSGKVQTVHRLDMGTSGLMVVSKTPAATKELNRQFRERQVTKIYTALVHGRPPRNEGRIVTGFERDTDDTRKFRITDNQSHQAVTEYRLVELLEEHSILEIKILTGRTHQIRVHLSSIGAPIAGDRLYGLSNDRFSRLMLHASILEFNCPRTGERRRCTASNPSALRLTS
jgi:23S rRNA pseudouridine1911/1915/1917 synthase